MTLAECCDKRPSERKCAIHTHAQPAHTCPCGPFKNGVCKAQHKQTGGEVSCAPINHQTVNVGKVGKGSDNCDNVMIVSHCHCHHHCEAGEGEGEGEGKGKGGQGQR